MTVPITVETTGATGLYGVAVRLVYDPADPYAVYVHHHAWTIDAEVVWVFGRELLDTGLALQHDGAEEGEGDVIITRVNQQTMKIAHILRGETDERHELILSTARLRSFLDTSYATIPPGTERNERARCSVTSTTGTPNAPA